VSAALCQHDAAVPDSAAAGTVVSDAGNRKRSSGGSCLQACTVEHYSLLLCKGPKRQGLLHSRTWHSASGANCTSAHISSQIRSTAPACSVKLLEEDERPKSGPHGVPRPPALSSVGSAPMPPPSPLGAVQPPIQPPGSAAAAAGGVGAAAGAVVPPSPRTQLTSRPSGEVPPSPAQQVGVRAQAQLLFDAMGSCVLHNGGLSQA
jgi:hypothetical protein